MTTTNFGQFLRVALDDLREGRRSLARRLQEVAVATNDVATKETFRNLIARSSEESSILGQMLGEPDGQPNLWANGIMDDALRDIESTAQGRARDVAVIGAIRKFLAADIVSLETAIALDQHEGAAKNQTLNAFRQQAQDMDHLLRERLAELTRSLDGETQ
ncbi:hypothetical protein P8R33_04240 [Qipengyuania sp. XHP0211]|uniref:hypothetical protein n=1 Tax=Qipengyuania sp. XHP0211 TaxID=3038079 RepID=UPI00241ED288|nr:hypothetical protein [Qipengyuania sp. XHP0211]MDG5750310.1 hypothetical protein [Qipengyuania sp. XHP0211]